MSEGGEDKPVSNSRSGDEEGLPVPHSAASQPGVIPPSPPQFISLDRLMEASELASRMQLVHEIALDDDFKLNKSEPLEGSLLKTVGDTMRKAFWDILSESLSLDPPDYSHTLVLIADVKEMLKNCLMPSHQSANDKIDQVMDMDLIKQKVENGAFDISYYAEFVTKMMSQLCAPARDEDIAKIGEITDIVPLFKEIFRVLEVMHMDMANITIKCMRPHIKEEIVNYEQTKFAQFLVTQEAAGVDGMEYTREWLERSYEILDEHTAGTTMFGTSLDDVKKTPANTLNGAYLELLNWDNNVFPETCQMDLQRFTEIAQNLRKSALISSILLVTFTHMGDKLSGHTKLRDRLKAEVLAIISDVPETQYKLKMVNISEHIVLEVNKELQVLGYQQLPPDQMSEYRDKISAVIERNHPVYALLWKRIMTFAWQSLAHSSSQPLQLPPGLGAVRAEIASNCGKFIRLCSHNVAVFTQRYSDIISTLMNVTDLSPRLTQ